MKKPNKTNSKKEDVKRSTKPPVFKKGKKSGKIVLPKEIKIDENIIRKTIFNEMMMKTLTKNGKQAKRKDLTTEGKQKHVKSTPAAAHQRNETTSKKITPTTMKTEKSQVCKSDGSSQVPHVQKTKKILPSRYITDEIAMKAVAALQKLEEQQKRKNKMFEDESSVFAQINCIKIQNKKTAVKLNLSHSTLASTHEVCLITTDLKKGRKHDHEPSIDHWEEVLRKAEVTEVKTVLPMRQLRVEYDQFELKRRLLTQHDMILVDSRIHSHVCHILGKVFMKKHNMLIPVRLHNVTDIKKNIQRALKTSLLHISEGPTSSVTIGHMGMSPRQLRENILSLVKQLAQKFPGGEHNIRSIGLKLPLSLTLPLYLTLRSKKSVNPPKIRTQLPSEHMDVEGELSTYPGRVIKISPEGTITIKANSDEFISELEDEELSEGDGDKEESSKSKKKKLKMDEINDNDAENTVQSLNTTENTLDEENEDGSEDDASENEDGESNVSENEDSESDNSEKKSTSEEQSDTE